ncbi:MULTISPECIES: hypothetical protein [Paenibacillus]|uniref:hypothetical protein n=1 Tax=Paenibacillus TaxID=44249 RepID=UPI002FE26623
MQVTDIVSMVANVGFPVTLCFILIKYVLETVGKKLDTMNSTIQELSEQVRNLEESIDGASPAGQTGAKAK